MLSALEVRFRNWVMRLNVRVRLNPVPGNGAYEISGSYQVSEHGGRQLQISSPNLIWSKFNNGDSKSEWEPAFDCCYLTINLGNTCVRGKILAKIFFFLSWNTKKFVKHTNYARQNVWLMVKKNCVGREFLATNASRKSLTLKKVRSTRTALLHQLRSTLHETGRLAIVFKVFQLLFSFC